MATVSEVRTGIQQRKAQLAQARQQVSEAREAIPVTTAKELRQEGGLVGRQNQRQREVQRGKIDIASKEIEVAKQQLEQQEAKVEEYLRTPSGRLQYAKEQKLVGKPIYGKPFKGASVELLGYEYSTPYGNVTDYGPRDRLIGQQIKYESQVNKEIADAGYTSRQDVISKLPTISASDKSLATPTVNDIVGVRSMGELKEFYARQPEYQGKSQITPSMKYSWANVDKSYSGLLESKKPPYGQISASEFVEAKINQGTNYLSKKALSVLPISYGTYKSLTRPVSGYRNTDLIKFGFFAPAMATTPEFIGRAIEEGVITPVTKTNFYSTVSKTPKGNLKVSTFSETSGAGKNIKGIGEQAVMQVGDDISVGVGKGYISYRPSKGVVVIEETKLGGVSQSIGSATKGPELSIVGGAGTGVQTKTLTQTTKQLTRDLRLGALKQNVIKDIAETPKTTSVIGTVKEIGKEGSGVYSYVGSSAKPTRVITLAGERQGTKLVSGDLNIFGFIREAQKPAFEVTKVSSGTSSTVLKQATRTLSVEQGTALAVAGEKTIVQLGIKEVTPSNIAGTILKPTSSAVLIRPQQKSQMAQLDLVAPVEKVRVVDKTTVIPVTEQLNIVSQKGNSGTKLAIETLQVSKSAEVIKPTELSIPTTTFATPQALRLSSGLKQDSKSKLRLRTTQVQVSPTMNVVPKVTPRQTPRVFVPSSTGSAQKKMGGIIDKGGFKVFARKAGKDIEIGKSETLSGASKILRTNLKTTLRASGFITSGGEKVRVNLGGAEFRAAKRDPLRIVQKRGFRLGTRSEVSEIKRSKRKRGKKNLFGL